jgi:hypothetical protein
MGDPYPFLSESFLILSYLNPSLILSEPVAHTSSFQVATAPPGTQAASLDIEGAYRTIPILPDHKRFLVVRYKDLFYIDHNLPFGAASAAGLQGEVANATVDIWAHADIGPAWKWVDDFFVVRVPDPNGSFVGISNGITYRYRYDLYSIKEYIGPVNIPWHKLKGSEFGDVRDYVRYTFDFPKRTVCLPEEKRIKYVSRLQSFLDQYSHRQVLKREAEKISGTLNHCAFVFPFGRSYLSNLYHWIASFRGEFIPRYLTSSVRTDLTWWLTLLKARTIPRSLHPRPPTRDYDIWVDASTSTGIGLCWNYQWDAWTLKDGWRNHAGHDIGWLEAIAVELAVYATCSFGISNSDVLIRSDNEGVIGAFRKGRSSNPAVNMCIRRSEAIMQTANLSISLIYVNTKDNKADPISRNILPPSTSRLPFRISIPAALQPFIENVTS